MRDICLHTFAIVLVLASVNATLKVDNDGGNSRIDAIAGLSDRELVLNALESFAELKARDQKQLLQIEAMEARLSQQEHENLELKKELAHHQEAIQSLQVLAKLQDKQTSTKQDHPRNHNRRSVEHPVVFYARALQHMPHIGVNQNLIFEHVVTNIGNAYNPHQGSFVAPVSGVYVFSSSVLVMNSRVAGCHFAVNGTPLGGIYASGTDHLYDQGAQTINVQLKAGDDVSVQNNEVDSAIYGGAYTTFSGFLIEENFEDNSIIG